MQIFQTKPHTGEICTKCWLKVEMFHEFYMKIEQIQTTTIRHPIVVENIDCSLKSDDFANDTFDDCSIDQEIKPTVEILPKVDDNWPGIHLYNHTLKFILFSAISIYLCSLNLFFCEDIFIIYKILYIFSDEIDDISPDSEKFEEDSQSEEDNLEQSIKV